MLDAVIRQELLLGGRRFSVQLMRWFYAFWLVAQVLGFALLFEFELLNRLGNMKWISPTNRSSLPEIISLRFCDTFIVQQMLLLLLLTPALTAGAITDEKRKGTLEHLLLTELDAWHLILGKLLGRLAKVMQVMVAGLPVFAVMAGFAGVRPISLVMVLVSLIIPLIGIASLALLASVWFRQTRDAILTLYLGLIVAALLVLKLGGPLRYLNPLYNLNPAWGPSWILNHPEAWRRITAGAIAWGLIAMTSLTLAIRHLRSRYLNGLSAQVPRKLQWMSEDREPIENDPIFWRERHIEGLAPNPTLRRIPQWLMIALLALLSTTSSLMILYRSLTGSFNDLARALLQLDIVGVSSLMPQASSGFLFQGIVGMLVGGLIVGIRCSGAFIAEREKHTWDAILLTPLTAREIVSAKLWGILGASYWYFVAYAAPAIALSTLSGPLGFAYTLLWLGATVLGMYLIGATGLWCSVHATSSWRSLLNTVLIGYLGGLAIYTVTSPLILVLMGLLVLGLMLIDWIAGTNLANQGFSVHFSRLFAIASAMLLVIIFFLMAKLFLFRTQRYISERERTRRWYKDPNNHPNVRRRL